MLIGITGGIGSGKTTIAKQLEQLGYPVYYTDAEAKRIVVENPMVRSQIETLFGSDIYEGDVYRTERVAKQVFHHADLLERLNAIVHPAVAYDLKRWSQEQEPNLHFVECAILFESGLNTLCDKVIAVTAPEEIRLERTLQRDYHGSHSKEHIAAVLARIHAQMSDNDRARMADIVLCNDEKTPVANLAQQVIQQLEIR